MVRPYFAEKRDVSFAQIPLIFLETIQQSMYVRSASQVGIIFQYVISRGAQKRNKKIRKRIIPVQERAVMSTSGLAAHTSNDKTRILLQTARANISDVDNCMQVHSRILFDSGSQKSYISETVRNKLKLKTVRTERVIINTFGQTGSSEVRKLDVVQFKVKHRTDSMFTHLQKLSVFRQCVAPLPTSISHLCMI